MTTPTITHKPRFNPTTLDNTLKIDNKQMSVLLAPVANTVAIACNEAIATYFKRKGVKKATQEEFTEAFVESVTGLLNTASDDLDDFAAIAKSIMDKGTGVDEIITTNLRPIRSTTVGGYRELSGRVSVERLPIDLKEVGVRITGDDYDTDVYPFEVQVSVPLPQFTYTDGVTKHEYRSGSLTIGVQIPFAGGVDDVSVERLRKLAKAGFYNFVDATVLHQAMKSAYAGTNFNQYLRQ